MALPVTDPGDNERGVEVVGGTWRRGGERRESRRAAQGLSTQQQVRVPALPTLSHSHTSHTLPLPTLPQLPHFHSPRSSTVPHPLTPTLPRSLTPLFPRSHLAFLLPSVAASFSATSALCRRITVTATVYRVTATVSLRELQRGGGGGAGVGLLGSHHPRTRHHEVLLCFPARPPRPRHRTIWDRRSPRPCPHPPSLEQRPFRAPFAAVSSSAGQGLQQDRGADEPWGDG